MLNAALRANRPVLFPANNQAQILRALDINEQLKTPMVLYGVQEGYMPEAAAAIAAKKLPAIKPITETDWQAAQERLTDRGLLNGDGLTEAGRALREHIEARTDTLAMTAYRGIPGILETLSVLTPAARAVARSGEVPYPNPMGADPA